MVGKKKAGIATLQGYFHHISLWRRKCGVQQHPSFTVLPLKKLLEVGAAWWLVQQCPLWTPRWDSSSPACEHPLSLCWRYYLWAGTHLFQTTQQNCPQGATDLAEVQSSEKAQTLSFSPIPWKLFPQAWLVGGLIPLGSCQCILILSPNPLQSQAKFPLLLPSYAKAPPWGRRSSSCLTLCRARRGALRDSAWKGELKGNQTLACRHDTQWVTGSVKFAHSAS